MKAFCLINIISKNGFYVWFDGIKNSPITNLSDNLLFPKQKPNKRKSSKIRNGKADVMQKKFGNYFERLNTNDYARIQCIRNWITWHIGMLDLCLFGLIITETQS